MVVEGDGPVSDMLLQEPLAALKFLYGQLAKPLEGGEGLGHEAGHGNGDLHAPAALDLRIEVNHLLGQFRNADDVLICFRRQAHHEVELHLLPALTEGSAAGSEEVFLRHALVDDIAHALGACLRGEGKAGLPDLLHLVGQVNGEAVYAQGGQGEAHLLLLEISQQIIHQPAQAGVICRGQGSEAHLIIAGGIHQVSGHLPEILLPALTGRTVADASLAEAAAAGTATEKLQHDAVMDDIHEGHQGLFHGLGRIHVLDDPLVDDGLRLGA